MRWEVKDEKSAVKSFWPKATLKVLGLTALLIVLLSVDYTGLAISRTLLETPFQLVFVAFADVVLLSYFVTSSRWTGWKEWGAVFAVFYGVNYVLTRWNPSTSEAYSPQGSHSA